MAEEKGCECCGVSAQLEERYGNKLLCVFCRDTDVGMTHVYTYSYSKETRDISKMLSQSMHVLLGGRSTRQSNHIWRLQMSNYTEKNNSIFKPKLPSTQTELTKLRAQNNPRNEPVGAYTGRCPHCGSSKLWDDNLAWGCDGCGALLGGN